MQRQFIIAVGCALFVMLVMDLGWISLYMGRVYAAAVSAVQQGAPMVLRGSAAVGAYALMAVALTLALWHGRALTSLQATAVAAAWGALVYGVYALTVLSIFRDFPARVAAMDIVWGAVLFGVSALAGRAAARLFQPVPAGSAPGQARGRGL